MAVDIYRTYLGSRYSVVWLGVVPTRLGTLYLGDSPQVNAAPKTCLNYIAEISMEGLRIPRHPVLPTAGGYSSTRGFWRESQA